MEKFKITSIRYFETRRGLGYECATNAKGISIWNDGNGGGTYLNNDNMNDDYHHLTEDQLERLIDKYEMVHYWKLKPLNMMEYNAEIQWNDTKNFEDVIITTNDITDDDDYIFFYFKDVNEIEEFKKIGVHEFRIISYEPRLVTIE